ncbi:uncharacterized, partial [Tachysurus ichikawai]
MLACYNLRSLLLDSPPFVIQQLECARVALLSSVQWGIGASRET